MDFQNTRIHWRRPLTSYSKIRVAMANVVRNRAFQLKRQRVRSANYLDVGCGPNAHADFVNLDYEWYPHIDVCWDVTTGLPFADERFAGIYSEHCIEHLPLGCVDALLRECHRVLAPGGTMRIIVPDGELYLKRYLDLAQPQPSAPMPYAEEDAFEGLYTPMMSVNRIFTGSGHRFIQDFETLQLLLLRSGFERVRRETFRTGRDRALLIDSESRAVESLYVEASKPASS